MHGFHRHEDAKGAAVEDILWWGAGRDGMWVQKNMCASSQSGSVGRRGRRCDGEEGGRRGLRGLRICAEAGR